MRDRGPLLVLVAILAVLGVRALPPAETKSAGNGKTANADPVNPLPSFSGSPDSMAADFWHPLRDFWETTPGEKASSTASWLGFPDVPGYNLEFLIATVPDPFDSTSGYRFDAHVDAILRAVETQDFVQDGFWFPWRAGEPRPNTSATATAKAIATVSAAGEPRTKASDKASSAPNDENDQSNRPQARLYERQPGAILFRSVHNEGATPRLLLLLLVGETATHGIHKEAFSASLDLIGMSKNFRESKTVRILGPAFSGSRKSYEVAIRQWCAKRTLLSELPVLLGGPFVTGLSPFEGPAASACFFMEPAVRTWRLPQFRVISGSATAIEKHHFEDNCKPVAVTFQATVHRERALLKGLFGYLQRSDPEKKEKIAFLSEANTAFGISARYRTTGWKLPELEWPDDVVDVREEVESKGLWPNVLSLPFPLHISDVRTAYDKSKSAKDGALPGLPVFGSRLPVPLEESGSPRDTEPTLTPAMTAVATEEILRKLLGTISQERIRYVFISATDLKDILFLATKLREHCPDVQLLLSGSDLLLTHPNYRADLKGTIVASTYPLYLANQHWTYPFGGEERHSLFPGDREQGYYNAAVALLADETTGSGLENMLEYGAPFDEALDGKKVRRPPVWISILGQDGPHPLYYKPLHDEKEQYSYLFPTKIPPGKQEQADSPHVLTFWLMPLVVVNLFVILLSLVAALAHWWKRPPQGANADRWEWLDIFASENGCQVRYRVFLCLAPLSVISFMLATTSFARIYAARAHNHDKTAGIALVLAGLAFFASFFVLLGILFTPASKLFRSGRRSVHRRKAWLWRLVPPVGLTILLCAVLAGLTLQVVQYAFGESRPEAVFYAERAGKLTSGVSPILPVILLASAYCCLGIMFLKRRYLLHNACVRIPLPTRTRGPVGEIHDEHGSICKVLRHPYRQLIRRWSTWIALAVVICASSRVIYGYVGTAEGFGYDFTFLTAFGVFAALLVSVLLYTRLLWKQLHALLRHIVLLPMVSAFNRLPGSVTVLFGPFLSSLRPSRQAIRTLRRQQLSAVAARYADCQKELEAELREGSLVKELESALGVAMREALRRERSGQFYASDYAHLLVPDWTWVLTLASGLVWDDVAANSGVKPDRWWDLTLAGAARTCLSTLEHVWAARSVGDAAAEKPREDKKEEKPDDEKGGTATGASSAPVSAAALAVHPKQSVREWIQAAEDFVAIEIVNYVSQYFVQLRNLVTFLTVGALLLLLAVVSYPFQPQRLILLIMGALILVLAGGAFGIFLQIEKDELTSRVLKTTPNRLSFHPTFLASVATYVLPLLGVLALASSDLSDLMHTLLDPLYKLIK